MSIKNSVPLFELIYLKAKRDNMNHSDAFDEVEEDLIEVKYMIKEGDFEGAESLLCETFGFEPDVVENFLFSKMGE